MKRSITILATILFIVAGFIGCNQSKPKSDGFITVDVTATYPKKELTDSSGFYGCGIHPVGNYGRISLSGFSSSYW